MIRWIAVVLLVVVAALGFVAWKRYAGPPQEAGMASSTTVPPQGAPAAGTSAAEDPHATAEPGLHWNVPAKWSTSGERPMRYATYTLGSGAAAAECAVFYFGPDQGGSVDENIDRWASQFDGRPNPKRHVRTVNGMSVTQVEIDGAYLSPGMDMQSQGKKPDWRLLGAIVQGPHGMVFFKFTGPAAALKSAGKDFDAMLSSLKAH